MSDVKRFCSPTGEMREAVGDAQLGWRYVRECDYDAQSAYAGALARLLEPFAAIHIPGDPGVKPSDYPNIKIAVPVADVKAIRAALAKTPDQRQGADSPGDASTAPSTEASSANGPTGSADSIPSDEPQRAAQSAPASHQPFHDSTVTHALRELLAALESPADLTFDDPGCRGNLARLRNATAAAHAVLGNQPQTNSIGQDDVRGLVSLLRACRRHVAASPLQPETILANIDLALDAFKEFEIGRIE